MNKALERLLAINKLSERTRVNYAAQIKLYLATIKKTPDEFVAWVQAKPKEFEEQFASFLAEVAKERSASTTAFYRDSVKKLLDINRVNGLDWNYINQFIPTARRHTSDRAPTVEEIRKLLSVCTLRNRCVVLFLISSGSRIGVIDYLRWGHIKPIKVDGQNIAQVTLYAGEDEEYTSFISPECLDALEQYRKVREKAGEQITDASWVFVTEYNQKSFDPKDVRRVDSKIIRNELGELMNRIGLRQKNEDGRYEFMQSHFGRKFFKSRMESAGVKSLSVELMMGHDIGVSASYYKPTIQELAKDYMKGLHALSVYNPSIHEDQINALVNEKVTSALAEFFLSVDTSKLKNLGLGAQLQTMFEKHPEWFAPKKEEFKEFKLIPGSAIQKEDLGERITKLEAKMAELLKRLEEKK